MRWRVVSVVIVRKYVDSVVYVRSVGRIGTGKATGVGFNCFDDVGVVIEVNGDVDVNIGDADIEVDGIIAGSDITAVFCTISLLSITTGAFALNCSLTSGIRLLSINISLIVDGTTCTFRLVTVILRKCFVLAEVTVDDCSVEAFNRLDLVIRTRLRVASTVTVCVAAVGCCCCDGGGTVGAFLTKRRILRLVLLLLLLLILLLRMSRTSLLSL